MRGVTLLVFLLLLHVRSVAQTDTAHAAGSKLDISYNNDTFTFTDIYYTHGVRIALSNEQFSRIPTRHLLLKLKRGHRSYGIAVVQDVFTPSSITRDFILHGDRPYAAYVYLEHFVSSADPVRKLGISSALDAGIIGPLAQGYEAQAGYHRLIHDKHPLGWENQVRNDVVLNYRLAGEKGLMSFANITDLTAAAEINAGTLYNNAAAGGTLRLGKMEPYFEQYHRSWQAYAFGKAQARAVGYNATLQGGMFNRHNVYTVPSSMMQRMVYSAQAGVVLSWRNIEVEHSYVFTSRELKTGMPHKWGRVRISAAL